MRGRSCLWTLPLYNPGPNLQSSEKKLQTKPKHEGFYGLEGLTGDSCNRWFKRFTLVALFNGFLALVWTVPVLFAGEFGLPDYRISKTIAGGSIGTWGFLGYVIFLVVGIGIVSLSAMAYYIIPRASNTTVYNNMLALAHLVLLEVGTLGASVLLAWTGYVGGQILLDNGPLPSTFTTIHENIVVYVGPIMVFVLIGILGGLVGLVNLAMTLRARRTMSH